MLKHDVCELLDSPDDVIRPGPEVDRLHQITAFVHLEMKRGRRLLGPLWWLEALTGHGNRGSLVDEGAG